MKHRRHYSPHTESYPGGDRSSAGDHPRAGSESLRPKSADVTKRETSDGQGESTLSETLGMDGSGRYEKK